MSEKIEEVENKKETNNKTKTKTKKENNSLQPTKPKKSTKTDEKLTKSKSNSKTNNQTATKKKTTNKDESTTTKKKTTNKAEGTTMKKSTTKEVAEESKKSIKGKNEDKVNNSLTINQQKELETIEKEIKEQETLSKEKMPKIYGNVFKNILYAIIILLYFILIIIGYNLIEQNIFITSLKALSIVTIVATIVVFEIAYKKDSGKLTVTGIEFLILSICTLLSIRAYTIYNSKFVSLLTSFALLFAIYYVAKATKGYIKEKRQAKKEISDINKIAKKETR